MSVSFKGFNEKVLSFSTASEIAAGTLVKMSGSGTVAACSANDAFIGVVISCRGNVAAVQVGGFATVAYTGTAPTVGYSKLCAGSAAAVKADAANGKEKLVLEVDATASTVGILL